MLYKKVRERLKLIFDNNKNEKLKYKLLQALPFWLASFITGVAAVLYARVFAYAEKLSASIFHEHLWLLFIVSPICFVGAWWIVQKFAPFAKGSGIPQVMAAIELSTPKNNYLVSKLLSFRIILVKVLSSFVFAIGGGAIGREGPTIQIAGSIFRKINEILPPWWPKTSRRNMIMTGAAAGLAAAFNTPLGGIVFAVEELTKTHFSYFKSAIFTAVIIAGLTAQALAGPYLYLGYPLVDNLSYYILFGVAGVAIIAGFMGSAMSKVILLVLKWKSKFKSQYQHIAFLILCSLVMACMAYFISIKTLGSGKELMTSTLFTTDKYVPWYMPVIRIVGPVLSFSTGAAGGVFAPGLSAGACIGSLFSQWFHLSNSDTNLLVLVGMVAFLTGITRSPFTSAILVLEMTDRNNLILHLMLAGFVASFVARLVDSNSFYEQLKHQHMSDLRKEEKMEEGIVE